MPANDMPSSPTISICRSAHDEVATQQTHSTHTTKTGRRTKSVGQNSFENFIAIFTSLCALPHKTMLDFEKTLSQEGKKFITSARDVDGLNLLHLAVKHNCPECLEALQKHGVWSDLVDQVIPESSSSQHRGRTPRQIAKKERFTKISEAIDHWTEVEYSMNKHKHLLKSARSGDIKKIQDLFGNQTDPKELLSICDYNGDNITNWASKMGYIQILRFLKEQGANFNSTNKKGENAVFLATVWGKSSVIKFLIKDGGADPNERNSSGRTPMEITALNGDLKSFNQLKQCDVQANPILAILAAYSGRIAYLREMNKQGVELDMKDKNGKTCLMVAAEQCHLDVVKYLLKQKDPSAPDNCLFKMNDTDHRKRTVYHLVTSKELPGANLCTELLLEEADRQGTKADVLAMRDLYKMEYHCYTIKGYDNGELAWHHVLIKRQTQPSFNVADRGSSMDTRAVGTQIASGWGERATSEELKQLVGDYRVSHPTKHDQLDITALSQALLKNKWSVAKQFLEAGADVNTVDSHGLTPLHFAAINGNQTACQELMNKGADLHKDDEDGKDAAALARLNGHSRVADFLESDTIIDDSQNLYNDLISTMNTVLSKANITDKRDSGEDVKRYLIEEVRNIQIQLSHFLQRLGSGPVEQPTD